MDLNALRPGNTPSPTMLDAAIRVGLVALLLYACGRIVLPFAGILALVGDIGGDAVSAASASCRLARQSLVGCC